MEVIQSFIYSVQHANLDVYQQRILLKVVQFGQSRVAGLLVSKDLTKWSHDFDNVKIVIPIRELLDPGNKHYESVVESARRLMKITIEYYNSDRKEWFGSPVIFNVKHNGRSGVLRFYVARELFDALLDFSKGFRQFNLERALSVPSPYASRLYSLMSGQVQPIRFSIDELKRIFGVENKYSQTADFIKKIIEPSRLLLNSMEYNSFEYVRMREGTKVVALLFKPLRREEDAPEEQTAKQSVGWFMTPQLKQYLLHLGQFTLRELGGHKVLLEEFCKLPNSLEVVQEIINRASSRGKGKGYIISAMRSEVKHYKEQHLLTD